MIDNYAKARTVPHDFQIVRVEQTSLCGEEWIAKKGIDSCGIYYLIDASLHVHICSLTPSLEAWPMHAFVTFKDPNQYDRDEGETEREFMASEEICSYFDTKIMRAPHRPASKYVDIPEPEDDELDEAYRRRVADTVLDHLCGNPVGF